MIFKNVTVRVSAQVINYGMPERWNVIETLVELEEGDTFEQAVDAAFEKVETAHGRHSQSVVSEKQTGDIYFNGSKQKEERL